MTLQAPETPRLSGANPGRGSEQSDISLTRIYLPFVMVIAFGGFLVVAGYMAGNFMSGIARDKTETESRLSAIEKEVTAIKNILADRAASAHTCNCRNTK